MGLLLNPCKVHFFNLFHGGAQDNMQDPSPAVEASKAEAFSIEMRRCNQYGHCDGAYGYS